MISLRGTRAVLVTFVATALTAIALTPPPAQAAAPRTKIVLKVTGCNGCTITPVQIKKGTVTYWGKQKTIRSGHVRLSVPTKRTRRMTFLVYAPFDRWASGGIPMVPITRYKGRRVGSEISWKYAKRTHRASACWGGTRKWTMRNTLIVKKVRVHGKKVAAGYFKRSLRSSPYWVRVKRGSYHSSDPSICR